MSAVNEYPELLKLIEISGPFVSLPVFKEVFPQGFLKDNSALVATLREGYDEWRVARQDMMHTVSPSQREWLRTVFTQALEWPEEYIAEHNAIPQHLSLTVPQHQETLRPDLLLWDGTKPQLLVQFLAPSEDAHRRPANSTWNASYIGRMAELLTATQVPLGLITNGERWTLVYAERQQPTGTAQWLAELWFEERLTLRAFRDLAGARSFFGRPAKQTLASLYRNSLENQQEVSTTLGRQVRSAVELFVAALDRENREHHGELLRGVDEEMVYEAALSVMMRLVFLLFAEEQDLLPIANPVYHDYYAVSTIHTQLRQAADNHGEEVLEHRFDAFPRLLATFRAVHGGVEHDLFSLPAYGGHLFDPDRYAFLELRSPESAWHKTPARPYPVNNRTVLHLLEALQFLNMKVPGGGIEKRRISFRALDIEQIGHVYEGLLDHTAKRADEPILGLAGSEEPEIPLLELETHSQQPDFLKWLKEQTGRSVFALEKALKEPPPTDTARWPLWESVKPFAGLVRRDDNGDPWVIQSGSIYVTAGAARRQTGTQYTPRSLTREVARYALEPVCYIGPAEGKPPQEWQLKSAAQLLDLKVCDPACGSGAFLAEACRYIADRLAEAWQVAENQAGAGIRITPYGDPSVGIPGETLLPKDENERLIIARRLTAQRCLYGVDRNPLAVEMAKLSLWLLTLEEDKPFTFLDHAIRCGDSLLGVNLKQLQHYNLSGTGEQATHLMFLTEDLRWASEKREGLAKLQYRPEDQERMLKDALARTRKVRAAADLLIATAFEENPEALAQQVAMGLEQQEEVANSVLAGRRPFHWPVEFPEVFAHGHGFDAIISNPPFMGGSKLETTFGPKYRAMLVSHIARGVTGTRGSADLCTYFLLRAEMLCAPTAVIGTVATNSVGQGDGRDVGLSQMISRGGSIIRAVPSAKWPGRATVYYALIWFAIGPWRGDRKINDDCAPAIDASLNPAGQHEHAPVSLLQNKGIAFEGAKLSGEAFVVSAEWAAELLQRNPDYKAVLRPYLTGALLNSSPDLSPTEFVITFYDWPLSRDTASKSYIGPVASDYPECLAVVDQMVRPIREQLTTTTAWNRKLRQFWWHFGQWRWALDKALGQLENVLVLSRVTPHLVLDIVDKTWVFSDRLTVFATDSADLFAVLQSVFHETWSWRYGTTNLSLLSYSPSACFLTLPLPRIGIDPKVSGIVQTLSCERRLYTKQGGFGLTELYNRFHSSANHSREVERLRILHLQLDQAVALSYGWNDIDLSRDFHKTSQGIRFTISEPARREVLARLLALNHERHAAETAAAPEPKRKRSAKKRMEAQPALF